MNQQTIIELVEKIAAGVATDAEIAQFNQWYQSFQKEGQEWPFADLGDKEKIETAILQSIEQRINILPESGRSSFYTLRRIAAAVIVLIIAAGGFYWYSSGINDSEDSIELVIRNDVGPGEEKAVLTLGDGSQIMLDEANTGLLASEGSTTVKKSGKGLITYQSGNSPADKDIHMESQVVYNTISTPRGGKYKVLLPDETEVWLNAMSSIRFPTQFTEKTRQVEITGEVFFDVTRNKAQPFWVRTGDQVVKVLGTQFNVKAYSDEETIRTTLVEGSVIVETAGDKVKIEPGEQVVNQTNSEIAVEDVDVEQVIAWKNGLFQFWDTNLKEIMRQLSRWYDVDVTYLSNENDISFTGFISRDVTISNVLHMLEEAGDIRFGLDGSQVVVKTGNDKQKNENAQE